MNIDWTQAPPWARFAAMGADGTWYWYASRPDTRGTMWSVGLSPNFEMIDLPEWTQTLTERPTE